MCHHDSEDDNRAQTKHLLFLFWTSPLTARLTRRTMSSIAILHADTEGRTAASEVSSRIETRLQQSRDGAAPAVVVAPLPPSADALAAFAGELVLVVATDSDGTVPRAVAKLRRALDSATAKQQPQRRRRSLARSIARARCGGGDGDGGCGRSRRT